MKSLIERFRDAGLEPRSYSGRAMYGKQCVGVSGDRSELENAIKDIINDCLQEAFDRGAEEESISNEEEMTQKELEVNEYASLDELQEFVGKLLNYKQDQLGLGMIYYWPSIEWEEEEEEN